MGDLGDISPEYSELLLHHRQKKSPCTVVTAPQEACEEGEGAGVLLYYKYVDLGEDRRSAVKGWYLRHCGAEGLRGRYATKLSGRSIAAQSKAVKTSCPRVNFFTLWRHKSLMYCLRCTLNIVTTENRAFSREELLLVAKLIVGPAHHSRCCRKGSVRIPTALGRQLFG